MREVVEFRVDHRTASEEMVFRAASQCCGHCSSWIYGWAVLMSERSVEPHSVGWFLGLPMPDFSSAQQRCLTAMEEAVKLDSAVEHLGQLWDKEWRNPMDNRFGREAADKKAEEYGRLYGGRSRTKPGYTIEG